MGYVCNISSIPFKGKRTNRENARLYMMGEKMNYPKEAKIVVFNRKKHVILIINGKTALLPVADSETFSDKNM